MKLCRDCKYSKQATASYLVCVHPEFVKKDPKVLGGLSTDPVQGVYCIGERAKTYLTGGICGVRGALWESKIDVLIKNTALT